MIRVCTAISSIFLWFTPVFALFSILITSLNVIDCLVYFLIVVRVFRVRKLLELQSKLVNILLIQYDLQSHLSQLLEYVLTDFENRFDDKLHTLIFLFSVPHTFLFVVVVYFIIRKLQ